MHCPRDSFESKALDLGDCIGVESCVDLKSNLDIEELCMAQKSHHRGGGGGNRRSHQRLEKMEKEFPPPIPWLARTGNLPSHMPWIMKRYYTNDGRLIIKEEKVKRHEYLQAERSNGRLTLRLVPLNNDELDDDCEGKTNNEFEESEGSSSGRIMEADGGDQKEDGLREDQTAVVEIESRINHAESCMENGEAVIGSPGGSGSGIAGKCYKYMSSSMSRSSCMLGGIAVAAIRSVHT